MLKLGRVYAWMAQCVETRSVAQLGQTEPDFLVVELAYVLYAAVIIVPVALWVTFAIFRGIYA